MLEVVVDSRVRIRLPEEGNEELLRALRLAFTHANPEGARVDELKELVDRLKRNLRPGARDPHFLRAYAMWKQAKDAPSTVCTWRRDDRGEPGWISFPRGGMSRVRELLRQHRASYRVSDRRCDGDPSLGSPKGYRHNVELRDFQEVLVASALERQNCLWRSPVGSGKTSAAIAFIVRAGVPALVVVWTGNVFAQWVKRLQVELGLRRDQIGIVRGGKTKLCAITVAMQQSLRTRIELVRDKFGAVVCDEIDRFGAPTFVDAIDALPARYRLGVSDDERRKDRKEFLIYDLFGQVAHEVDRQEVIDRGYTHDVEWRIVPTSFAPEWYAAFEGPERAIYHDQLIEEMMADEARNAIAIGLAKQEVAAGRQVLLFSARVEHCVRLEADLRSAMPELGREETGRLIGGVDNEREFQRVVEGYKSGRVRAAAGTYPAVKYGIDMPSVSCGIGATPIHSNRTSVRQASGRICRRAEDKHDAVFYYLLDPCFGLSAFERLRRWVKNVRVWNDGEWIAVKDYLELRHRRGKGEDAAQ